MIVVQPKVERWFPSIHTHKDTHVGSEKKARQEEKKTLFTHFNDTGEKRMSGDNSQQFFLMYCIFEHGQLIVHSIEQGSSLQLNEFSEAKIDGLQDQRRWTIPRLFVQFQSVLLQLKFDLSQLLHDIFCTPFRFCRIHHSIECILEIKDDHRQCSDDHLLAISVALSPCRNRIATHAESDPNKRLDQTSEVVIVRSVPRLSLSERGSNVNEERQ